MEIFVFKVTKQDINYVSLYFFMCVFVLKKEQ